MQILFPVLIYENYRKASIHALILPFVLILQFQRRMPKIRITSITVRTPIPAWITPDYFFFFLLSAIYKPL